MVPCRFVEEMETVLSAGLVEREDGHNAMKWSLVGGQSAVSSKKNWLSIASAHACSQASPVCTVLSCSLGSGF